MNAYDLGTPSRNSSEYTVVLLVIRNKFAPEFLNAPYTINVPRTTVVNSNVGQVFVVDRDTDHPFNVWRLSATGDGSATSYFGLRTNGTIYVRNSLLNVPDTDLL